MSVSTPEQPGMGCWRQTPGIGREWAIRATGDHPGGVDAIDVRDDYEDARATQDAWRRAGIDCELVSRTITYGAWTGGVQG